jgi:hypothetical protein
MAFTPNATRRSCSRAAARIEKGAVASARNVHCAADVGTASRVDAMGVGFALLLAACQGHPSRIPGGHDPCVTDDDCMIAADATQCCSPCPDAYSKQHVASEACLATPSKLAAGDCRGSCEGQLCPGNVCATPPRAVCSAGKCTASHDCGPGNVLLDSFSGTCHAACVSHADCVAAIHAQPCCPLSVCPTAYFGDMVSADACIVPAGAQVPPSCADSPTCNTTGGGCRIATCPAQRAVCMEDGKCELAPPDAGCPAGYVDTTARCLPGRAGSGDGG